MKKPVKLVLLGISSQYIHSNLAPWCLVNGLKTYAKADYQAVVREGTVNEPVRDILDRVVLERPDLLGISCYIWNIQTVALLLPLLKKALPACLIALGGPEAGYRAKDALLSYPEADFVLSGEGELPFARLVDAIFGLEALENVPGLSRRTERGFQISEPFLHDTTQGSPYTEAYFDALNGRIAYLETSRGCPYSCAFCLSGRRERLRQAPLDQAFSDILLLANSGAKTIKLVDRTFNADRGRALLILRFIASKHGRGIPEGVAFHFEIAGDLLDEETLDFLRTAPKGLFQFEIGLQSMSEKTLRLARRSTNMAFLVRQVSRLIAMGTAHVHLDLIAGLPEEDLSSFKEGFNEAYLLRPQALQLGFLKLIHGSAMREDGQTYPCAFDRKPPYEVLATPSMSEKDFAVLKTAERALDKLHNSGRFPRTLRFLTAQAGLEPFDLFLNLGQAIVAEEGGAGGLPLDKLNNCLYTALCALLPEHTETIRDLMVMDRLSSTKTSVMPRCLKRREPRMHFVRQWIFQKYPLKKGALRVLALLHAGEERIVFCDYEIKDPVTGLYDLTILPAKEQGDS